jgi:S-adenosylmethionine:tRNA ribosyltransferase-isomerase
MAPKPAPALTASAGSAKGWRSETMLLSDFDFELPPDRIALRPASPRDQARLLVVDARCALADRRVADLPGLLAPGDAVVFNRTKVIRARLAGRRLRDGAAALISANLHRRLGPSHWTAFARPGKRLAVGDRISFGETNDRACLLTALEATVAGKLPGGEVVLAFDLAGVDLDLAIADRGTMPLPPYIASRRAPDEADIRDYQTIYARDEGSVAAPTAGLHFTAQLLAAIEARGIETHFVTLNVGGGTFLPVKTPDLADHRMHPEFGEVDAAVADALNAVRARGGRIVCVGTTTLRLLESAAGEDGRLAPFAGETDLFITPGYPFRIADALITNFHLPRSTLFVLVSAFSGPPAIRAAYAHAIDERYRFYSYGDACLLWRSAC